MSSPELWGPRLWRLLHILADMSDRRDIYPLWNTFLKWTAAILPCQKCQKHMSDYWHRVSFLTKGWDRLSGEQVRAEIRGKLHTFHNVVNESLGKPHHPLPPIQTDRHAMGREAQELWEGLREEWSSAHLEWKRSGTLLLQLVKSGST